jgi:hypothetical protein
MGGSSLGRSKSNPVAWATSGCRKADLRVLILLPLWKLLSSVMEALSTDPSSYKAIDTPSVRSPKFEGTCGRWSPSRIFSPTTAQVSPGKTFIRRLDNGRV